MGWTEISYLIYKLHRKDYEANQRAKTENLEAPFRREAVREEERLKRENEVNRYIQMHNNLKTLLCR